MFLKNDLCKVEIVLDNTWPSDDAADYIYNPQNYAEDDYYKTFLIHLNLYSRKFSIALIGDGNCYEKNCAVLEGKNLTILQGWDVLQIDVTTGLLTKACSLESNGCNFEIHKVNDGYLIYGEIDITMLNHDLQKKWSFSGYDVFCSITGKKSFEIKPNYICLYDFYDNYYEIDFDGHEIIGPKDPKGK